MKTLLTPLLLLLLLTGCSNDDVDADPDLPQEELYFPPASGIDWETSAPNTLGWNENELEGLYDYLESNSTRAFIVLKDGKIVVEKYWGSNITNTASFDSNSQWYWASAGKTLTATLVGIAQQEGFLNINDKTSDYLGMGWTSMVEEKEDLITLRAQLTMTTGLEYQLADLDCTEPSCLEYKSDAGTQWFYHNAPYTLLEQVVSNATGIDYNLYTDQKIESVLGMNGQWIALGYNNVYWSTARDMARFGLLILNNGKWNDTTVISDVDYLNQMVSTSQGLNPSYGYLWWLNGKSSIIFPALPNSFNVSLSENAPDDLFAGMGKNGQFVEVVPSQNLVVIRMGEAPDGSLVPVEFHDEMWGKLNTAMGL